MDPSGAESAQPPLFPVSAAGAANARGSLDPSGSDVPGKASAAQSSTASGAANARGSLDPSGSDVPGKASAAQINTPLGTARIAQMFLNLENLAPVLV